MKKNQKGFTLIELLAVIIILAIIALIAVPTVMNIIQDSKDKAAKTSANGVVSAAELWYSSALLKLDGKSPLVASATPVLATCNGTACTITGANSGLDLALDIKGTVPEAGIIEIDNSGNINTTLTANLKFASSENLFSVKNGNVSIATKS
ncbi:MAG: prepilin-type N-terminal cleavage/methylation domain-containing protein [Bacilli bacterium]